MAQDFDFRKRPVQSTPPATKSLPTSILNRDRTRNRKKIPVWVWAIIILLVVGWAVFFYYLSLKPAPVSQQPTSSVSAKTPAAATLLGGQATSDQPQVTLYNSGAGNAAVEVLATKLTSNGYTSQNLGESQFQLDQTYIWYQAAYLTDVQKIQTLLAGKKVALRPYNGTGPYKILVQLGP